MAISRRAIEMEKCSAVVFCSRTKVNPYDARALMEEHHQRLPPPNRWQWWWQKRERKLSQHFNCYFHLIKVHSCVLRAVWRRCQVGRATDDRSKSKKKVNEKSSSARFDWQFAKKDDSFILWRCLGGGCGWSTCCRDWRVTVTCHLLLLAPAYEILLAHTFWILCEKDFLMMFSFHYESVNLLTVRERNFQLKIHFHRQRQSWLFDIVIDVKTCCSREYGRGPRRESAKLFTSFEIPSSTLQLVLYSKFSLT